MPQAFFVKRILVVDDYEGLAEMLATSLMDVIDIPLSIDIGVDGVEALSLAIEDPPAVAILDLDMPEMNGTEAAIAIRAALPHAVPLMIAITGDPTRLADAGEAFDHVLLKPVDIERLAALVEAAESA